MTTLPQQTTIKQYTADGVTTNYTFAFWVTVDPATLRPDVDVYVTPSGQTPIPESDIKVWGVDYTVTFNSDPITGGYVTFLSGKIPALNATVTLDRNVSASLTSQFVNAQNFNGANLDNALMRLLLLIQQNKTYIEKRVLSYVINALLPDVTNEENTQLPTLGNQQIWIGLNGGVVAATLEENPDVSTLRSELANNSPGTSGTTLLGYYDTVNATPTTVDAFLNNLQTYIANYLNTKFISSKIYTDTGSANAMDVTIPAFTTLTAGTHIYVKPAHDNTGASTITINGGSPINIYVRPLLSGVQRTPFPGDILSAGVSELISYDGSNFLLVNPLSQINKRFYGASLSLSNNQTFPASSTITKILFDTVNYDPYSIVNGSNSFTVGLTGYYLITSHILVTHGDPQTTWSAEVYVNNVLEASLIDGNYSSTGSPDIGLGSCTIIPLNAGDIVDLRVDQGASTPNTIRGLPQETYFNIAHMGT